MYWCDEGWYWIVFECNFFSGSRQLSNPTSLLSFLLLESFWMLRWKVLGWFSGNFLPSSLESSPGCSSLTHRNHCWSRTSLPRTRNHLQGLSSVSSIYHSDFVQLSVIPPVKWYSCISKGCDKTIDEHIVSFMKYNAKLNIWLALPKSIQ